MNIGIISNDRLWLDSMAMSLDLLFDCEPAIFSGISKEAECYVLEAGAASILLLDSAIPGVDYWELLPWLNTCFQGKVIVISDSVTRRRYAETMRRTGCFAVVDKSDGLVSCWSAIRSAEQGACYHEMSEASPFRQLSVAEQGFANDLLEYDETELSQLRGISQQAINKKKLSLYRKLNIASVPRDKTYRVLAKMFQKV